MNQTVYVLVKVKLDPCLFFNSFSYRPVDPYKVISQIDYQFSGNGVIDTEITDVALLDKEEHPYIAM
jgi:hypothetical protein